MCPKKKIRMLNIVTLIVQLVYSVTAKLFEKIVLLKISSVIMEIISLVFGAGLGVGNAHAVLVSILETHERMKKPDICMWNRYFQSI